MSDAEDVVGSKRRNIYTPNYFQLSEDDETAKALAVEHVDLFLEEKERREHFLQPLSHAYPSNKDVRIDEYTWDSSWRDRVSVHWFERKKVPQDSYLYSCHARRSTAMQHLDLTVRGATFP